MINVKHQILSSLIGTLLGFSIAGCVAVVWVDHKVAEISRMVDQKVLDVTNAPARAAAGMWESVKQAASDIW